jgi:tRNA threonylcarbamoyladenosine biosynthesis protein TsaB
MKILAMDTSTLVMGVAIVEENRVLGEVTTNLHKNHSVRLMPTVVRLLEDLELSLSDLGAIAVTSGPGSYTGIRIGVTTAKTMAWAAELPIYSESSLTVLAMNGIQFPGLIVPMFDARRKRVYSGVYRSKGNQVEEIVPQQVIELTQLLERIKERDEPVLFLGDDVAKFQEVIRTSLADRAQFGLPMDNIPRPSVLGFLAYQKWARGEEPERQDFALNYLQMTEAEAKWLNKQRNGEMVHGTS